MAAGIRATPEERQQHALKIRAQRARKRRWIILGVAVVVAAVLAAAMPPFLRLRKAKNDVDILALALYGFAFENNGRFPQGTPAQIAAILRGQNIDGQNPKQLDYIVAKMSEMNANGEFIDPWGMPYQIHIAKEVRVYSCGPNRQDDNGDSDDICSWK